MATYSLANERLRALEDIEREIGAILQNAGSGYDDEKGNGRESKRDRLHMRGPSGVGRSSPSPPTFDLSQPQGLFK